VQKIKFCFILFYSFLAHLNHARVARTPLALVSSSGSFFFETMGTADVQSRSIAIEVADREVHAHEQSDAQARKSPVVAARKPIDQ
jgi:hypothetical protein